MHCRKLNFSEVSSCFSQTFSLALNVLELILPSPALFFFSGLCSEHCGKLEHCVAALFFFFFFFFFLNFSCLCSDCSKSEHCVASFFSVYIIILRFSSFFFSIYLNNRR